MAGTKGNEAQASEIRVEVVEYGRFHSPVVTKGDARLPGIVLVHDVWGPSEHSDALARDLCREGFGVLEIDLYRALDHPMIEDVGEWIGSLSDPDVLSDLERGADWLEAESVVCGGRKVGIVGVCMGGTYALLAACRSDRFAAAAPFYGILSYEEGLLAGTGARNLERKPSSPIEAAPRLNTPLLASFGGRDGFVPEDHVQALEAGLERSRVAWRVDRYPQAGHAFLNQTRPEAYDPEAAVEAWGRVIPFLHAALDGDRA
jgi:carboxymethylenebutenolidase